MVRHALIVASVALIMSAQTGAQTGPDWIDIAEPQGAKLRAAMFRPIGEGPFPVLLVLHGGIGLSTGYVAWAREFARWGFLAIVACWSKGNPELSSLDPCPHIPHWRDPALHPLRNVMAVVDAARKQPAARSDRIGLIGDSLGAIVAVTAASSRGDVGAVVSVSGGYGYSLPNVPAPVSVIRDLRAPLLILHGTQDELFPVSQARAYEGQARELGKTIYAYYYEGSSHNLPHAAATRADVIRRSAEFLNQYLR